MRSLQHPFRLCSLISGLALLASCGGGGGSGSAAAGFILEGTAATGAAMAGATVQARCKNGSASTTAETDGSFRVELSAGSSLPCILKAVDPVTQLELHSLAESGASRANITPVTELVAANLLGATPSTVFANFHAEAQARVSAASLSESVRTVQVATAALGTEVDLSEVDVMKGRLKAATDNTAGDAADRKIDALMAALSAADRRISDLSTALKTATAANAGAQLLSTVGDAAQSLASCPFARSGDVWVYGTVSGKPLAYRVDFKAMVLLKKGTPDRYAIEFVRDSQQAVVPCAFRSTIGGVTYEYRVSEGGLAIAYTAGGGSLIVPAQKIPQITDASFAGAYPALAFVRSKTDDLRLALPIRFEIDRSGNVAAYGCDLNKSPPECLSSVDPADRDDVSCTLAEAGLYSCASATSGLQAFASLFINGSQATLVMSIGTLNVAGKAFSGLVVMTKAVPLSLPAVGSSMPDASTWYATSTGSTLNTGYAIPKQVTSVDAAAKSYTASYIPAPGASPILTEYFLDAPARGFVYWKSPSAQAIQIRTKGWTLSAVRPMSSNFYSTWTVHVRSPQ